MIDIEKERADFEAHEVGSSVASCFNRNQGHLEHGCYTDRFMESRWDGWQARATIPQAPAESKLPHGHRDDYYLMVNARMVAEQPIAHIRAMPNWVFASGLFATGSASAHAICVMAGIDPDATRVVWPSHPKEVA